MQLTPCGLFFIGPRDSLLPIPELLEHILHTIHLIGGEARVTTTAAISHDPETQISKVELTKHHYYNP